MSKNELITESGSSPNEKKDNPAHTAADELCVPEVTDSPPISVDETENIVTPAAIAEAVADKMGSSGSAMLEGSKLVYDWLDRYGTDKATVRAFTTVLFHRKMLTWRDVHLGTESSKLSKLRLIGEYSGVLNHPDLLARIDRGYTHAYRYAHWIKYQPGKTHEERLARVLKKLRNEDESLRRKLLKNLDAVAKNSEAAAEWHAAHKTGALSLLCSEIRSDLVLITPNAEQLEGVSSWKVRDRKIGPLTEDGVGVVVSTVSSIPKAHRLLVDSGFKVLQHVLLAKQPAEPDIRGDKVILIAVHSSAGAKRVQRQELTWPKRPVKDWRKLVERWIPDAIHKRHTFATEAAEGWECIDGAINID